jgi:hypothetical protein
MKVLDGFVSVLVLLLAVLIVVMVSSRGQPKSFYYNTTIEEVLSGDESQDPWMVQAKIKLSDEFKNDVGAIYFEDGTHAIVDGTFPEKGKAPEKTNTYTIYLDLKYRQPLGVASLSQFKDKLPQKVRFESR